MIVNEEEEEDSDEDEDEDDGEDDGDDDHKSHSVWKLTGKMPDANPAHDILCEPAQAKRTWTFYKSHFA